MARIKRGTVSRRKHNKIRLATKGYRMTKRRLIRAGHEAILHAGQYAFHGRKLRKRDMRSLWIVRINGAVTDAGLSYSKFISGLHKNNIEIDRKILSFLVTHHPEVFKQIVKKLQ